MFKWSHEITVEIEAPLQKVWNFFAEPSNWSLIMDGIDSCQLEGEFKADSTVTAKMKNKMVFIPCLLTRVQPLVGYEMEIKNILVTQVSSNTFQALSDVKTVVVSKTCATGILVPFMKKACEKSAKSFNAGRLKAVLEQATARIPAEARGA